MNAISKTLVIDIIHYSRQNRPVTHAHAVPRGKAQLSPRATPSILMGLTTCEIILRLMAGGLLWASTDCGPRFRPRRTCAKAGTRAANESNERFRTFGSSSQ